MGKISKKDQDPHQTDQDKVDLDNLLAKKSQHFAVGTRIVQADKGAGEIIREVYTKSSPRIYGLHVRWDDGSISLVVPIALNRR